MQADAWFVEHIKNAGQAGADLRREPNALRFAAGERAAFAIEREITEPDFDEKLQARFDFAHHFGDDRALLLGQLELADVFCRGRRSSAR